MPRSFKRVRKRRTIAQIQSLTKAQEVAHQLCPEEQTPEAEEFVQSNITLLRSQAHALRTKYWNERRRAHRLFKANTKKRLENKNLKIENTTLKRAAERLSHDLSTARASFRAEMQKGAYFLDSLHLVIRTYSPDIHH